MTKAKKAIASQMKLEIRFFATLWIGVTILFGFWGFGYPWNISELPNRFIWEIVLFAFVLGTLLLSSNYKYSKKEEYRSYIRFGSSFIISGIIILFGAGLLTFSKLSAQEANHIVFNKYIGIGGLIAIGLGAFFLSILIAELLLTFGGRVVEI